MKPSPSVDIDKYIRQEWQFVPEPNPDTWAIINFIDAYSQCGTWLDLGCGPMLTIWPLFSSAPSHVCGLDRNPEVLSFHESLRKMPYDELPQDVDDAYTTAYRFRRERKLQQIPTDPRTLLGEVKIKNLLEPELAWCNTFNTVVQIGCFGCLETVSELEHAATIAYACTAKGGVLISATWLPRPEYIESKVWGGSGLRQLSLGDIIRSIERAGYTIKHAESTGDINVNYNSRILIAASRK